LARSYNRKYKTELINQINKNLIGNFAPKRSRQVLACVGGGRSADRLVWPRPALPPGTKANDLAVVTSKNSHLKITRIKNYFQNIFQKL
jgi:hypothetical protein